MKYVYHGSHYIHDRAVPRPNRRITEREDGSVLVKFDQVSFHATPHKWIAAAYTYIAAPYKIDGKTARYNMGVSLYEHNKVVYIYGFESLEKSLKVLYKNGGYISVFNADDFHWTDGLGDLEVITKSELYPVRVEYLADPVAYLESKGVVFTFIDLADPKNEELRNYKND